MERKLFFGIGLAALFLISGCINPQQPTGSPPIPPNGGDTLIQLPVPVYAASGRCPEGLIICPADPIGEIGTAQSLEIATQLCNVVIEWQAPINAVGIGQSNPTGTNYDYYFCDNRGTNCRLGSTQFCSWHNTSETPVTPEPEPIWITFCYPWSYSWVTGGCELIE